MQTTKRIEVTIKTKDDNNKCCDTNCQFHFDFECSVGRGCNLFTGKFAYVELEQDKKNRLYFRCDKCLVEFGE